MSIGENKTVYDLITAMENDFIDLRAGLLAISCIGEYARLEIDCLKETDELGHALAWISDRILTEVGVMNAKWKAANGAAHALAYPDAHKC
jgi:hypothetical protein